MAKLFLCLILSCVATIDADEVHYILRPSRSQSCGNQPSRSACDITFSEFINNSTDYLTNDTRLIFSSGNYSLESELVVENVHSFSMFAWPGSSSKAVITCGQNARFEFRNVSTVTVSGFEFIGCLENHVIFVDQFQLENSEFFGSGQPVVNGTALIIEESVASLDRIAFVSAIEILQNSAMPQVSESCYTGTIETTDAVIGISLKRSNIRITQSRFEGNNVGLGAVIYNELGSDVVISNTVFANNSAAEYCNDYCCFAGGIVYISRQHRSSMKIYHNKFERNVEVAISSHGNNTYVNIVHNQFVNNLVIGQRTLLPEIFQSSSLVTLAGVMATVSLSEFVNNKASIALVNMRFTTAENLTNNVFIDNSAVYEVYVSLDCRPGHGLSLGSSRCIQCSENWLRNLIGIVVAAFIAGIALVIFMSILKLTVAVGTLNGMLFYANIVAANAETYFLPFTAPDFITVFISWLNLDIGFDICFYPKNNDYLDQLYKALLQLAFPAYIILLVIIMIVASEHSSKLAKIIGKGNPVAVLATMISLSYAKIFNVVLPSFSLLYWQPAYGSHNVDVTRLGSTLTVIEETVDTKLKTVSYFLIIVSLLILLLCVIFTAVVFSWQWLLQYQDNAIFKWVKYQKLRHFLEPYHAPYTANYRYWTGSLQFVCVILYLISLLNFSLDPRVHLMAVIFAVGGLILPKGVIAKRVYKNWPLDVMETAIYFNLVAFSALTWYNLDFGGNQVSVAYTSVIIIFILLLGVIVFHVLYYTRLYKCSFIEKAFKWTFSKLLEKKPKEQPPNDELDGYRLERSAAGDLTQPTVTFSVIELTQPAQNYTD